MRRVGFCIALAVCCLVAPAAATEECSEKVTIGNFEIVYMGAIFDGFNTNFAYCVTGGTGGNEEEEDEEEGNGMMTGEEEEEEEEGGGGGFKDLSNWLIALDVACIDKDNLVACGPAPCFYQENDPNTGITGIKWDDTKVGEGETVCYNFTLEGDWTDHIHETTAAIKAGTEVAELTGICGPVCFGCSALLEVMDEATTQIHVRFIHNRPPTITTPILLKIVELERGGGMKTVAEWTEGPVTFDYGTIWEYLAPIPGIAKLPAGNYMLSVKSEGMSGWDEQRKKFRIK